MKWTADILNQKLKAGTIKGYQVIGKQEPAKAKRAKYGNTQIEWNGEWFDSIKELNVYKGLLLRMKAGEIGQLERQVKFLLVESVKEPIIGKRGLPLKRERTVERKTEYWADFVYMVVATGERVVVDAKSEATRKIPSYVIKRKLMLERYGIQIREV